MSRHARPRDAATVLLLRDGAGGLEVFMMVRHQGFEFAPGALVFPGGSIDPSDRDPRLRARCAGAAALDDTALAFRVAAIREAFEESGILLARSHGAAGPVGAERLRGLESRYREAVGRRDAGMLDLLEAEDLELATDAMRHFAHWITPEPLPKRFDTRFFITAAPADQVAAHDGVESTDSVWMRPGDVCAASDRGQWLLMFVTRMNLERLGRSATVAEALAAAATHPPVTVTPRIEKVDGGRIMHIPAEAGYGASEIYDEGTEHSRFGFRPMSPDKVARLKRS